MAAMHLVLTGGGLRGLTAAASVMRAGGAKVVLMHVNDHRADAGQRRKYARLQAQYFGVPLIDVDLPRHITREEGGRMLEEPWPTSLSQVLVAAVVQAAAWGAERVIWPVQVGTDAAAMGRVQERLALIGELVQMDLGQAPPIHTPLLELTDRGLVQLAAQLNVPFEAARSCVVPQDEPCRVCKGCRRRLEAFAAAGVVDPLMRLPAAAG